MSLYREDRELHIKLAELLIRQQHVVSLYTVLLATEFSFLVLYVSLSFILFKQSDRILNAFVGMLAFVVIALITVVMYRRQWSSLETKIENLKKEYLW